MQGQISHAYLCGKILTLQHKNTTGGGSESILTPEASQKCMSNLEIHGIINRTHHEWAKGTKIANAILIPSFKRLKSRQLVLYKSVITHFSHLHSCSDNGLGSLNKVSMKKKAAIKTPERVTRQLKKSGARFHIRLFILQLHSGISLRIINAHALKNLT